MSEETLNDRLRKAAEMARQRQQGLGIPPAPTAAPAPQRPAPQPQQTQPIPQPQMTPARPAAAAPAPHTPAPQAAPKASAPFGNTPDLPEVDEYQSAPPQKDLKKGKGLISIMVLLGVLLAGVITFLLFRETSHSRQVQELKEQQEQLELANQQLQLSNEYDQLNNEFAQYENQTSLLANDSIVQKYSAARAQVEKLLQELKNEKNKSAAQISKLKGEIATLKGILRTYVEQIDSLSKQNQALMSENKDIKQQNQQLAQTVQSVQANNKVLNERMTLAEKLNVTGVTLTPLNKKGKTEKNVTKARQLMVTFTIPQNNSTPVGEKTIYCRITNPEGELLGNGGSFSFEGGSVACTARKSVEYAGEEIGGIRIYWDVNATLTPGDYTVELFADNYRLASRRFTLKK